MGQTVPAPSQDERERAERIIEQGAVEALAFILSENRWLSNIVHNQPGEVEKARSQGFRAGLLVAARRPLS